MLQYILRHHTDALRSHHNFFTIDIPNHFICDFFLYIHCFYVVNSEWKNIFIINRIHNRIAVKLIAESLSSSNECWILCFSRISRENRCSRKSKQMIFLKILYDSRVHISELATMAFIKNNDDMFHIDFMARILFYKGS